MTKSFHHAGVSFAYPETWTLEPEDHDDGWGLSLHSTGTAFVTMRCHRSMPTAEDLAEAVISMLREDYADLEAEARVESLAGQMALGHDYQFSSLDLTNTGWSRCLYSDEGTLLILCQVDDTELDAHLDEMRSILRSLRLDDFEEEA